MIEKEEAVNASGQQDGTESAAVCISVMLPAVDDGVPKTTERERKYARSESHKTNPRLLLSQPLPRPTTRSRKRPPKLKLWEGTTKSTPKTQ